jgi:ketosteroid isomerase-like protein
MRRLLLAICSIGIACAAATMAPSTTAHSTSAAVADDEQQLRALEADLAKAEFDAEMAKRVLADDFVAISGAGKSRHEIGKKESVENVQGGAERRGGQPPPYEVVPTEVEVHIFGNTAVVVLVKEYHGLQGEAKGQIAKAAVTDVFTKSAGVWQLRLARNMPVPEAK